MSDIPSHRRAEPAPAPADTNDPDGINVDRDGVARSPEPASAPETPSGKPRKPASSQE
jgi:hypothetical protein